MLVAEKRREFLKTIGFYMHDRRCRSKVVVAKIAGEGVSK